jgi:hypothetical protein
MERYYDGPDCYPWRKVFALWPVRTIGGRWRWLKQVYKRKFWETRSNLHMEPEVEYAELIDLLRVDYGTP